jgi:hypothetical protein
MKILEKVKKMGRECISDFRFRRESNSDESNSDLPELIAEARISELPDYFRIRRAPISELPGERRLRVDVWYFDRLPYADLTTESSQRPLNYE